MKFIPIDMDSWARKEHFEHYWNNVRCSYSATVNIDITDLLAKVKHRGFKHYPVQIYMLATVANQFSEFRMSLNEEGKLGYWEEVCPLYTVLNPETETFSCVWSQYSSNFQKFYTTCIADIGKYATGEFAPQNETPSNIFTISSAPWIDFTAFNINTFTTGEYLLPIFTIGKYARNNGRTFMSLAIQVHHAVCDGLHLGRFVEALRSMAGNTKRWLS